MKSALKVRNTGGYVEGTATTQTQMRVSHILTLLHESLEAIELHCQHDRVANIQRAFRPRYIVVQSALA